MADNLSNDSTGTQNQPSSIPDTSLTNKQTRHDQPINPAPRDHIEAQPQRNTSETAPIVEVGTEHQKIPEAVEGWLEKLERGEAAKPPQPVTDDQGQTIIAPTEPAITEEQIILPMTENEIETSLKAKIKNSARWLAEWCLRIAKKFPGSATYRSEDTKVT